jgi:hypothetical protein
MAEAQVRDRLVRCPGAIEQRVPHGARATRARVRIEPLGTEIQTDPAGNFQADVPPGKYEVVVEAPGHRAQHRHVDVAADGVVILNADLSRGPK